MTNHRAELIRAKKAAAELLKTLRRLNWDRADQAEDMLEALNEALRIDDAAHNCPPPNEHG